jgi:hypothetical protein
MDFLLSLHSIHREKYSVLRKLMDFFPFLAFDPSRKVLCAAKSLMPQQSSVVVVSTTFLLDAALHSSEHPKQ